MRAHSAGIPVPHQKVAIITPTLPPRVSNNPLIFLSLPYDSYRMIQAESFTVCKDTASVFGEITCVNHSCNDIAFN